VTETIKDSLGRELEVQRPNTLERMKLMRVCGKSTDVDRWFGMVMLAACVRAIDGIPLPTTATPEQGDTLVARVGDEGMAAVANWAALNPPEGFDKDAAKN
jgi:hypothetical protein